MIALRELWNWKKKYMNLGIDNLSLITAQATISTLLGYDVGWDRPPTD